MNDRILLFIPMYNCAKQIGRVVAQLRPEIQELLAEVIVVDNRSTDDGQRSAISALKNVTGARTRLLVNDGNYGLGGSHKVAFNYALENGFDYVIVLHGDDQGDISDIMPYLRDGSFRQLDALLGARFMKGSNLSGYSAIRTLGNHVFNALYSIVALYRIYDLGSGLNLYAVKRLSDRSWLRNADDLTFNYHMVLRSIAAGWRMRFFPLSWREDDQISNVKLVRQSLRVASLPMAYLANRQRYLAADYSANPAAGYTSTVVYDSAAGLGR